MFCANLGGEMSLEVENRKYILGNEEKCFRGGNLSYLWVPVVQGQSKIQPSCNGDEYEWLDDRQAKNRKVINTTKWERSQPNGLQFEPCVVAHETASGSYLWRDNSCISSRCFVCQVPVLQTYYLRGLPGAYGFDQKYSLAWNLQQSTETITFEGHGSGRAMLYPFEAKMEISNLKKNVSKTFEQNQFGIIQTQGMKWVFTNVSGLLTLPHFLPMMLAYNYRKLEFTILIVFVRLVND